MSAPDTLAGLVAAAAHAESIEVYRQAINNPAHPVGTFWHCDACGLDMGPYVGQDLAERTAVRHAVEAAR